MTQEEKDAQAKKLYLEGDSAYQSGQYAMAIKKFEEAFALSGRHELKFNLANAYERLGRLELAIRALKEYRPHAPTDEQSAIDTRIEAMEKRLAGGGDTEPKTAPPTPSQPKRANPTASSSGQMSLGGDSPPPRDEASSGSSSRTAGYVLLGVGGVGLATWGVLGLMANSAHADAEEKCKDGFCMASAKDDLDREKSLGLGADIALGVGIVGVGVGLALVLSGGDDEGPTAKPKPKTQLALSPTTHGSQIMLSGSF